MCNFGTRYMNYSMQWLKSVFNHKQPKKEGTGRSCSQDELMAAGCGLSLVCKVLKHKIKRNESTACKNTTK